MHILGVVTDMDMAKELLAARHSAGLTQDELAEAIGVDKASVHRWETGQRQPRGRNLRAVRKFIEHPTKTGQEQAVQGRLTTLLPTDEEMLLAVWRRLLVSQKAEIMNLASSFLPAGAVDKIADELLDQARQRREQEAGR